MTFDPKTSFTKALHHRQNHIDTGEPISVPIVPASTYKLPNIPEGDYQYGRVSNPTWDATENIISMLENAPVVTFPSGMAAISAVLLSILKPNDKLLIPSDGYYVTRVMAEKFLKPLGVIVQECSTLNIESQDFSQYRMVLLETPSNPKLDLCDLQKIAAKCQAANVLLVVDNTTMTPLGQQPLDLGADIVVASDTKALNGHSDTLFGHVASRNADIIENIREWRKITGAIVSPHDAWLVHRGLETLEIRFERMCQNASFVATQLSNYPVVSSVVYPGLTSHPAHQLAKTQMQCFGSLIGVEFRNAHIAERFINECEFIVAATSFGGIHTSAERRARWGDDVAEGYVRLSLGIEPTKILWSNMQAVLDDLS
ncbi:MAG: cystathionine gamma-lyase [Rhizobiales bacterium]|nr:cystathionine gamma-lyase [Hyphomicrobiales bacterium]NRB13330.1 cystathionine gamma-lyase [Hyphomicrobiales bacterium]